MKILSASINRHDALRDRWEIPSVDQIMIEERVAGFTKRSIKTSAKLAGLKLAISMIDLTTLEGKDTPGKVAFRCRKAMHPASLCYDVPSCGLRLSESCPCRQRAFSALRSLKSHPLRPRFQPG